MARELVLCDPPEMGWEWQETGDSCDSPCVNNGSPSWIRRKIIPLAGIGIAAIATWRAVLYYRVPGN